MEKGTRLKKQDILIAIINGLDAIPKPKEGKGPEPNYEYAHEIREAFNLSRKIMQSDNISEMNKAYIKFRKYIVECSGFNY